MGEKLENEAQVEKCLNVDAAVYTAAVQRQGR